MHPRDYLRQIEECVAELQEMDEDALQEYIGTLHGALELLDEVRDNIEAEGEA